MCFINVNTKSRRNACGCRTLVSASPQEDSSSQVPMSLKYTRVLFQWRKSRASGLAGKWIAESAILLPSKLGRVYLVMALAAGWSLCCVADWSDNLSRQKSERLLPAISVNAHDKYWDHKKNTNEGNVLVNQQEQPQLHNGTATKLFCLSLPGKDLPRHHFPPHKVQTQTRSAQVLKQKH